MPNELWEILKNLKDPLTGIVICGLFYLLWMKERYCQSLSVTLTKCVTLLEMLVYGHKGGKDE